MTDTSNGQCLDLLTALLTPGGASAHKLRAFLVCFAALSPTEREALRSVLTASEARAIASLGVVAAEQALNERNGEWLEWSLLAHDVEQFREDPRNNLRMLAATHHAAEELGMDPVELFDRVSRSMSERAGSYVREFAARPHALRTLEAMGVEAVREGDRVRFRFE